MIFGEEGDDRIYGSIGNATMSGGEGQDALYSSASATYFVFDTIGSGHEDTIYTFNSANDQIVFSDVVFVFNSGDGGKNGIALTDNTDIYDTANNFSGGSFGAHTDTAPGAGNGATFLYDVTDGQLWYDADGNLGGAAILVATIDNLASYTYSAGDFMGWT